MLLLDMFWDVGGGGGVNLALIELITLMWSILGHTAVWQVRLAAFSFQGMDAAVIDITEYCTLNTWGHTTCDLKMSEEKIAVGTLNI